MNIINHYRFERCFLSGGAGALEFGPTTTLQAPGSSEEELQAEPGAHLLSKGFQLRSSNRMQANSVEQAEPPQGIGQPVQYRDSVAAQGTV